MLTVTATMHKTEGGDVRVNLFATDQDDRPVREVLMHSNLVWPEYDRHLEAYEPLLIDPVRNIAHRLNTQYVLGSRIVYLGQHVVVIEFDCGN